MRLIQGWRMYFSLGWIYMSLLAGLLVLLIFILNSIQKDEIKVWISLAAIFTLIMLFHFHRKDHGFLRKLDVSARPLIFLEYLILSLPIWIIPAIHLNWLPILTFFGSLAIVSVLNPIDSGAGSIGKRFPFPGWVDFEFRSAIRRAPLGGGLLILAGLASFYQPYLVLVYNFLFLVMIATAYQHCESRPMLEANQSPPGKFLKRKMNRLFLVWLLTVLPLNTLILFLFSPNPYLILASVLLSFVISFYFLLAKYAYYKPNEDLASQSATSSLVMLGYFIPIFSLMAIVILLVDYSRAKNRLQPYLNDFH